MKIPPITPVKRVCITPRRNIMKEEMLLIKKKTVEHVLDQLEAANEEDLTKPVRITEEQWRRMNKRERARSIFYWGDE